MSKKCENCANFLKVPSFGETMGLCLWHDCRCHPDSNAKHCEGFKRPKYKHCKKKYEPNASVVEWHTQEV